MSDNDSTSTSGRRVETPLDLLPHAAVGVLFLATILGGIVLAPPGVVTADQPPPAPPTEAPPTATPAGTPRPTPTSPTPTPTASPTPTDTPTPTEGASIRLRPPVPGDPGSFLNVAPFVGGALLGPLLVLAAIRFGGLRAVRGLFVLVFGVAITLLAARFAGVAVAVTAGASAVALVLLHPEWYVMDVVALLAGVFLVSEFGQFAGPLPVLVVLVGFAAYDAYSVYATGHMERMAEVSGELLLPLMYVVPRRLSFSLRESDPLSSESNVAALGLGDAIFPGLLAVSGGHFLGAPPLLAGTALNLPALGALLGSAVGYVALMGLVVRVRRVHAGLPVLNAAVIAGYLLGALAAGIPLLTALGL